MNKEKPKEKIKRCTYCQKMDNSTLRCQNKKKEVKEINQGAIGVKKEEVQNVESNQGSQ